MTKRVECIGFARNLILTLACLSMGCASTGLPRPLGDIDRATAVDHLLVGSLEPIEGLWVSSDSRYEIVVVAQNYRVPVGTSGGEGFQSFDYVGVITETRERRWSSGELKLVLKKTADPTLFIGDLVLQTKRATSVTATLSSSSSLKITPTNPAFSRYGQTLVRTHPSNTRSASGSEIQGVVATGTGFTICPGVFVTNQHVIDGAERVRVRMGDRKLAVVVVLEDSANDIAILRTSEEVGTGSLQIATSPVQEGAKVFTIGFPMSSEMGGRPRFGEGVVSSQTGLSSDPRILHVTVPVHPGNSGGPLLTESGQLAGVVTSRLRDDFVYSKHGVVPQGVNFAVKSSYVAALLEMIPECGGSIMESGDGQRALTGEEIMRECSPNVVQVIAEH